MPNHSDSALRLLIVDDSVEDAEAIVSALRNDGIAVRPLRPSDADELAVMLAEQQVDLVLAAQGASSIPLGEVMRTVASSDKDIPIVGLVDDVDPELAAQVYAAGARRLGLRGEPAQLLRSIRLEWNDLETRRSLRRLDAQVRETERRCDALIESSRDPIAYVHEGMHIRANPAYLEMFGFDSFEDVEGMSLLDLVAAQHVEGFKRLLKSLSRGEPPPPRYELEARGANGETFPATMEFTQAMYEGEPCLQVVFRRQEFDPELAREVEELRQRDQVTGLLNRPTFLRALEDAVADAGKERGTHGLLLVEPDHYQRLLHEIGLDSADAIAVALARRLQQALAGQPDALAARFGEHTFAVLLRGADHVATDALAERLRAAFDGVMAIGEHSSAISASIGGVQIGERIANVTQVLARAHDGVQSSLGVGGNRYEIFDPSATDRAEEERIQAWVERLRNALANDDFVLHYQPVISLRGEPGARYEARIRLQSGDLRAGENQTIAPGAFLPLAEEHGLMAQIDRWVVARAIRELGLRERIGNPVTLMVKVSQASLGDDALIGAIRDALAAQRVPGERLVLLLSEAKVFTQLHAAQAFSTAVEALGCRTGLEEFGAGLDSSQLLAHLGPAFVKLDRSFSIDLPRNADNQRRIRELAQRSQAAGIRTVAEEVQDAASMSILFGAGIDYVQGTFLAPLGPAMDYDFES
jgi:diguanylate cyclase (GGDEF)-like protein/PAS domain S-box-containing protein